MDTLQLGDIEIVVTRKDVKNVHLSVHPPEGRVTLVAPARTRLDVLRAYAITRLSWIRKQRAAFSAQAREAPRRHVTRESHYLWGRRYLLDVQYVDTCSTSSTSIPNQAYARTTNASPSGFGPAATKTNGRM